MSDVIDRLGKEFGTVLTSKKSKNVKDRIREIANTMNIDSDTIQHFSDMRKMGKVAILVPYRNRGNQGKVLDIVKLRARSMEISERLDGMNFDLFAMDVGNEAGKSTEWLFKAEPLLPESACDDLKNMVKMFYEHNVFGYFTVLDDSDMTDKELALYALFVQFYIKEKIDLHSWIFACDIKGNAQMSPYLFKIEKVA